MKLTLPAPAKINTFLHVVGRREDGYHLLESVMVLISLADTVELTLREDRDVNLLDPPDGITAENDLACRAARALQAVSNTTLGVDIRLTKRIPQGAGLGGGSSDAATTLLGLNKLWNLRLTRERLCEIGLTLGADVPFFVFGRAAFMSGVGEKLAAMTVPRADFVLAHPGVGVATPRVFAHPDLKRDAAYATKPQFNWDHGVNNLEVVTESIEPAARRLSSLMRESWMNSRMSGSGSAYFARMPHQSSARAAAASVRWQHINAWAVHSIERHPLYDFAKSSII